MTTRSSRFVDDFARLVTDAAGVAHGVRREAETVVKTQAERLMATMNIVTREEFEAVREMAALARDENEALLRRIKQLEARLDTPVPPHAGETQIV